MGTKVAAALLQALVLALMVYFAVEATQGAVDTAQAWWSTCVAANADPAKPDSAKTELAAQYFAGLVLNLITAITTTAASLGIAWRGLRTSEATPKAKTRVDVADAADGEAVSGEQSLASRKNENGEGCFVAGTVVHVSDGAIPIEEITIGRRVSAWHESSGATEQRAALATFVHRVPTLLDLRIGQETISCTPEHPFWVAGTGWIRAGDLRSGDMLMTLNRSQVQLDEVVARSGTFTVYNMTVEAYSTYHVSKSGILVHNKPVKYDPRQAFDSRKLEIADTIAESKKRLDRIDASASDAADIAEAKRLRTEAEKLGREVSSKTYVEPPAVADPAYLYDPLENLERRETAISKSLEELDSRVKPRRTIPSTRPALDAETVLDDGTGTYTATGKTYDGRKIYTGSDGKYYYVDNLHRGKASEIEVFSSRGEHLGTMTPDGVFNAEGKVKGRYLKKNLL